MANGWIVAIYISPVAGGKMELVEEVEAIAGAGLKGDRYCTGEGSFNQGECGKRQVTLINSLFFQDSRLTYADSRRNLVVEDTELMYLIGREFTVGGALLRGIKYCDPCDRPSKLSCKPGFREEFFDRGGLVAEIIRGGIIKIADLVVPPAKGYE